MITKFSILQKLSLVIALLFTLVAPVMGYLAIGLPPVIIVGGSALIGLVCWYITYLKKPVDPKIILPLFLLTVAGLQIHIIEEYLTGFAPAMSRLFGIPWSEKSFLMVFALVGPTIYTLTALGLYYKVPIAGFVAWFIFIGPGVAEFTHFIFPLIKPQLDATTLDPLTASIHGKLIVNMRNYYLGATGNYYFPGMWTAILPMIPGIYAIYRLFKLNRLEKAQA
ncbi:hypothetical protein [Pedobacter psychrodurus]|uniref:hypothetical protein n=1 Tax=Pedobacter psychrodurus TaxID=2530456 RepID=UPI0029306F9B|nr:hypothetical protein [Pedobacter psychrodurus]